MLSSLVAFSLLIGLPVSAGSRQDSQDKALTVEQRADLAQRLAARLRTEVTSFEPGWVLDDSSKESNVLLEWTRNKQRLFVRLSVSETSAAAAKEFKSQLERFQGLSKGTPVDIGDEGHLFGPRGGSPMMFRSGNFLINLGAPSESGAKRVAEIVAREIQALTKEP